MNTYRLTYSNETHSYSEILDVPALAVHLYIPGEWIGKDSLHKNPIALGFLEGLDQSDDCPPAFRKNPPSRFMIEDLTPLDSIPPMPKPMEDILL